MTATRRGRLAPRRSLASVIGRSPRTITRMANAGLIPPEVATRLPSGRWRYDLENEATVEWIHDLLHDQKEDHDHASSH